MKPMNSTICGNSLATSRLVFGVLSRLPIIAGELPKHMKRVETIARAHMEVSAFVANPRILTALNKNVLQHADHEFQLEDCEVLYSENYNN